MVVEAAVAAAAVAARVSEARRTKVREFLQPSLCRFHNESRVSAC